MRPYFHIVLFAAWTVVIGCSSGGSESSTDADDVADDTWDADDVDTADTPDATDTPTCEEDTSEDGRDGENVCSEAEVAAAAAGLCGVYLPPQVNVTDWSDERLEQEWSYHATAHATEHLPDAPPTHALTNSDLVDAEALRAWQERGREALIRLLRLDAATWADTPLDVRTLSTSPRDGYTLHVIDYLVEPGQRVPAFLLVPDGLDDAAPGIVLWHGHGPDGKDALIDEPTDDFNRYHAGAHHLALAGYVVLAPDIRSFGETGSVRQHEHYTMQLLLFGRVALGVFAADATKAVDVLAATPGVDPERLGVGGTSLGGEIALLTAVLEPRVDVTVVNGYLASYRGTTLSLLHCVCQYVPLMAHTLDIADIAALAAPARLHFVTGAGDPQYTEAAARAAFEQLERAWAVFGATEDVSLHVHEGVHEWVHEAALVRFDAALRPSL